MTDYIINFTDPLRSTFLIRPYTSNGPKFPTTAVLNDTSVAANSTLLLYGKGHPNYGERTDENLLQQLEHFAGASEPAIKVSGMLWYKEVFYYLQSDAGSPVELNGWYAFNPAALAWDTIDPSYMAYGTSLPTSGTNGHYYFLTSGSPSVLYQYSSDERGIDAWIPRAYVEAAGVPTDDPTKSLLLYNGTSWDELTISSAVLGSYLRLDTSNDPLTGDLDINKASPVLSLTGDTPLVHLIGNNGTVQLSGANPTLDLDGQNPTILLHTSGSPSAVDWTIARNDASDTFEISDESGTRLVINSSYITPGAIPAATYEAAITGVNEALANVLYVDNAISAAVFGAISGDTYVSGGSFGIVTSGTPPTDSGTLVLTFNTAGSPEYTMNVSIGGFNSDQIPFTSGYLGLIETASTVDDALIKAAPLNNPIFTGLVTVPVVSVSDPGQTAATKDYVDSSISAATASTTITDSLRFVTSGVTFGSPAVGDPSYTMPWQYKVGSNRLMVFVNGVKQYKNELASAIAYFSPILVSTDVISGLGPVGGYTIADVDVGTNTWTVSDNYATDFYPGDTFVVQNNPYGPANTTYTVVSAAYNGTNTDIVVVETIPSVGSPGTLPAGEIGINYTFSMSINGQILPAGSPPSLLTVNKFDCETVADLINAMQAALDAAYGSGLVSVYLYGGSIRVDLLQLPTSSPIPDIFFLDPALVGSPPSESPSALFASVNLVVDGFSFFGQTPAIEYGYYESDGGGSPAGVAPSGSYSYYVEFNTAPLDTDVIEFLYTN